MAAPVFRAIAREHLARLSKIIDHGGAARVRKLYAEAQADLERKLGATVGRGGAPFTAQQYRAALAQVRQGQVQIARRLGEEHAAATVDAQRETLGALVDQVQRAHAASGGGLVTLPIEEAAHFADVLGTGQTSLLAQNRTSMARYSAGLIKKMEGHLATGLLTAAPSHEVVAQVAKTADVEWWKAERIVKTEQAWAANKITRAGIEDSAEALGGVWSRWTELVEDDSPTPLDDRVGADSVGLHGQVAHEGGQFTMPDSARSIVLHTRYGKSRVSADMIGESWGHPPNRPADRATLIPWRPEWGVPGWECVGGQKRPVHARHAR